ncbi:hypothetical protein E8E14_012573 [Neopestalotiopsis sp. 37M]|nr:hypothetical protein E8E14_012573 [Neopestalotiopsis sp. 37M]
MRRGTRRGQSIADTLRVAIRDDAVPSPESSPDSPDTPGSPDSVASSPSPTSTTFNTTTAKAAPPSTTQTVPPPPPATTSTKSSLAPPPSPTTTTSIVSPPPATTTNLSPVIPPTTTTSTSSAITKTASPYFNHPELSTTGTSVRTTVISSSAPRTTSAADSSPQPVLLNPAASTVDGTGLTTTATRSLASPAYTNALTSTIDAERLVSMSTTSATAEAVTVPTGGLGFEEHRERLHLDAGAVAGIAIGSSVATMLIAALVFFFWRKWNRQQRRDETGSESGASTGSGVRRMLTRRFTHKSDDRIMNELMAGVYSNESGGGSDRNSFMDRQMQDGNGYIREKFGNGSKPEVVEDELPVMANPPKTVAAKPQFKRTKRISRWLGRQDNDDEEMMNPHSARASLASNATGLRTIDLRSMSGWGGSEYGEYFSRDSMPPLPMAAIPPKEDPEVEKRKPLSSEVDMARREEEESQNVQGQDVRVRDSTPVTKFASPEELKLPPPPGRPTSVAARTEVTGRSSGTWNTWGVMQHRDQPKGWKERLGM